MNFISQFRSAFVWCICLTSVGVPVLAQPASVIGTWCEIGGGETIFLEEYGIGFNEHTVCIGADPLTPVQSYQTVLSCKNIYFVDGEAVEAFEQSHLFSASISPEDQLQVTLDDQSTHRVFARCEP